jgi:hypothetical protein
MPSISTQLLTVDDSRAMRMLARFPETQSRNLFSQPEISALASYLEVAPAASPSEGELARRALELLSQDPEKLPALTAMMTHDSGTAEKFTGVLEIATAVAVIALLQSYIEIKRDRQGRWEFTFKKAPANTELIKKLVAQLLPLLPKS